MRSRIGMQDFTPIITDHEPDVQQFKAACRNDEKVHRADRIAMISQKRHPSLALFEIGLSLRERSRDRSQTDWDTELLHFCLDSAGPPRILSRHLGDELTNVRGYSRTARPKLRNRAPVEPKTLPVPADHCLRLHDQKGASPTWPQPSKGDSKSPISGGEARARLILSADRELLPKRQLDDGLFLARPEQRRQRNDENGHVLNEDSDHQRILNGRRREIETECRAASLVGRSG
jgi:hypothetical protein